MLSLELLLIKTSRYLRESDHTVLNAITQEDFFAWDSYLEQRSKKHLVFFSNKSKTVRTINIKFFRCIFCIRSHWIKFNFADGDLNLWKITILSKHLRSLIFSRPRIWNLRQARDQRCFVHLSDFQTIVALRIRL